MADDDVPQGPYQALLAKLELMIKSPTGEAEVAWGPLADLFLATPHPDTAWDVLVNDDPSLTSVIDAFKQAASDDSQRRELIGYTLQGMTSHELIIPYMESMPDVVAKTLATSVMPHCHNNLALLADLDSENMGSSNPPKLLKYLHAIQADPESRPEEVAVALMACTRYIHASNDEMGCIGPALMSLPELVVKTVPQFDMLAQVIGSVVAVINLENDPEGVFFKKLAGLFSCFSHEGKDKEPTIVLAGNQLPAPSALTLAQMLTEVLSAISTAPATKDILVDLLDKIHKSGMVRCCAVILRKADSSTSSSALPISDEARGARLKNAIYATALIQESLQDDWELGWTGKKPKPKKK